MRNPLAYHITFTTYGTWLHGDGRGSVSKALNQYSSDFVTPSRSLKNREKRILKNQPVILNKMQRKTALEAILQVCNYHNWFAHAVHVRSNHIHIVVYGKEMPEKMMAQFKAYATRAIKKCSYDVYIKKYWTRHGSTRYIWKKDALASTIEYVKTGQGKIMVYGSNIQSPERE